MFQKAFRYVNMLKGNYLLKLKLPDGAMKIVSKET